MMNTDTDVVGDAVVSASGQEMVDELARSGKLDVIFDAIDSGEVEMTGQGGFVPALIKAALERGLQAELSDHLGYEKGDPSAREHPNSRNGTSAKTVSSESGDISLDVPRDRQGSFDPKLVRKGQRRLSGLDDMIISLYAGGMTIREIQHHLASTIGTELSHETISNVTDAVMEEVKAWQTRPLDPFYPVMYLDAIVVKIKDAGRVANKAAHVAVGVDMEGIKHVLGIWVQAKEGAAFWAGVCADLANRGVKDVLIVCTDGLSGFPEAIEATWPLAIVQTCVVHLIRASMRFVSYKDRKAVSAALKPIYTASSEETALEALQAFEDGEWGLKYPTTVKSWTNAWERFTPFLAFPPAVRRVIYTTNAIESLNYQMRKITKNRGHFPSDDAAVKLLWLGIMNIEDKRTREREKERGKPAATRKAPGRLAEGHVTTNWKQALAQLMLAYPDRIEPYLHPRPTPCDQAHLHKLLDRPFTHGHTLQLGGINRDLLTNLAPMVPTLFGGDPLVMVDLDDTIREVHGYAKQAVAYGYNHVKGLNALVATISTEHSAPVIAGAQLRRGNVKSGDHAAWHATRALTLAKKVRPATQIMGRADSAFCTCDFVHAFQDAGCWFSVTIPQWKSVTRAISAIREDAWVGIHYTDAVFEEDTGEWISDAEVAEVPFTAFTSHPKEDQVTCRLVVRRVKRLNPTAHADQGELFDTYRYHPLITNSTLPMIQADERHRGHAIIEQVMAELKGNALAHLPSGRFTANAAWLQLAVLAFNISRAAAHAAGMSTARMSTLRIRVTMIPARLARHSRRRFLHYPTHWPWQQEFMTLWAYATGTGPPQAA